MHCCGVGCGWMSGVAVTLSWGGGWVHWYEKGWSGWWVVRAVVVGSCMETVSADAQRPKTEANRHKILLLALWLKAHAHPRDSHPPMFPGLPLQHSTLGDWVGGYLRRGGYLWRVGYTGRCVELGTGGTASCAPRGKPNKQASEVFKLLFSKFSKFSKFLILSISPTILSLLPLASSAQW